ncbi:MAG: 1-deoxy-D-xylulose-5-phosphate reductoisomerase [Phycisphaerales bacterium]|nr:1-deoxy-D-xylulose-5-phosphate reductoisomerase [Phycisphaerales bacterium]
MQRRVFILGSTGSIGKNTLEVIRDFCAQRTRGVARTPTAFEVIGLSAHRHADALAAQAQEFSCSAVAITNDANNAVFPAHCRVFRGAQASCEMLQALARRGDLVVVAIVGAAGIAPTLTALAQGCDIALANKETLVAAGSIVIAEAARNNARIIPIDSEHNALFQCLKSSSRFERGFADVRRVVLTASGGPFRKSTAEELTRVTIEDALRHPTWTMGPKVTVDSASLMNKALELIEAHWLFGLESDRLDAIVHPQSIVHGFVEFLDGSTLAHLSPPDMRTPIQAALTDPQRFDGPSKKLDWSALRALEFEPIDHTRFGAISLAHQVIVRGGSAGAVFNAANEIAVEEFLARRIRFLDITRIVEATLERFAPASKRASTTLSLEDVFAADAGARLYAQSLAQSSSFIASLATPSRS